MEREATHFATLPTGTLSQPERESTLLIVDDDEHVRRALRRVLRRARCRILDAPEAQSALEIMTADFVRTARSKGMSEYRVVSWHVLRNTLVLILTTIGLQFGGLIGQAVVVEKLFAWPGIGSLLVDSVFQRDIPAVQGCILVIVLFFLAINTAVDIAYRLIDPRIRYA